MKTTIQFEAWSALCAYGNHNVKQISRRLGYPDQTMKNTMRYLLNGQHVMSVKVPGVRGVQYAAMTNNPPTENGIERKKPEVREAPQLNFIATLPIINLEERI